MMIKRETGFSLSVSETLGRKELDVPVRRNKCSMISVTDEEGSVYVVACHNRQSCRISSGKLGKRGRKSRVARDTSERIAIFPCT